MTVPEIAFTPPAGIAGAPLIVLGPSLGTSTILWEKVAPLLAQRFRVTAWDLPGHGESPAATSNFTVSELAEAVAAGIHELGEGAVFYAGVSLGGATGLELLVSHPALVRAAAIVASGAQLGDPAAWHERAAQVRARSTSSVITGSAGRWFAPGSIERQPDLSGRLLHTLQAADDESYALCCEALADYDVQGRLGEISVPVLAVWGEHDTVAPEAKAEQIASGVRAGTIAKVTDAAHLPPAEQPEAVARLLRDYFEETR